MTAMIEHGTPLPTTDEEARRWLDRPDVDITESLHLLYKIKRGRGLSVAEALTETLTDHVAAIDKAAEAGKP